MKTRKRSWKKTIVNIFGIPLFIPYQSNRTLISFGASWGAFYGSGCMALTFIVEKPEQLMNLTLIVIGGKGCKEYLMRAEFKLPSVDSDEAEKKRPVVVAFQIPYHTVSGIQVVYIFDACLNILC